MRITKIHRLSICGKSSTTEGELTATRRLRLKTALFIPNP
jgi:hypothetical protein